MEHPRAAPEGSRRWRARAPVIIEHLESRRLLPGNQASLAPGSLPAPPAASPGGVPPLHSLPGAPAAVFLDFDGYGSYAPYDTDGSPDTFGPAEQAAIAEAWRQVASYFSMLDLDVTTEPPTVPYSYSIISNTVTLGQNLGNFPSVSPTNFNTTSHATGRPTALAHEIGHSLGLQHQSVFDV